MKRVLAIVFAVLLLCGLTACKCNCCCDCEKTVYRHSPEYYQYGDPNVA